MIVLRALCICVLCVMTAAMANCTTLGGILVYLALIAVTATSYAVLSNTTTTEGTNQ